jgi:hypothetical protein
VVIAALVEGSRVLQGQEHTADEHIDFTFYWLDRNV